MHARAVRGARAANERLAPELVAVLAAAEAAARASTGGVSPAAREVVLLARRGMLELARSVQSLPDLWATTEVAAHGVQIGWLVAESARTRGPRGACPVLEAFDGVLGACVRAQRVAVGLAGRTAKTAG
jgi:hypothetical protein